MLFILLIFWLEWSKTCGFVSRETTGIKWWKFTYFYMVGIYINSRVRRSVGRSVGRYIGSGLCSDVGGKVESIDDGEVVLEIGG